MATEVVDIKRVKQRVLDAPPLIFAAIAAAVDERRGGDNVSLEDKAALIIKSLDIDELIEGVKVGVKRGDAAMLGKVMGLVEKVRAYQTFGDTVINIEPYTVPDVALPHIIEHCALEQFLPIQEAVMKRRGKLRNSKPGRHAATRFRNSRTAEEREMAAQDARLYGYNAKDVEDFTPTDEDLREFLQR